MEPLTELPSMNGLSVLQAREVAHRTRRRRRCGFARLPRPTPTVRDRVE